MKVLFDKGMSTAEIGKRLGFSKNAIVGKINRLGWNMPSKGKAKAAPQPKKKKAAPPPPKPVKKGADPRPKQKIVPQKKESATAKQISKKNIERVILHAAQLMALKPDQCRWPLGDPDSDEFRFCGEKCFARKPYCFEHCKNAYQFTTPVKKK